MNKRSKNQRGPSASAYSVALLLFAAATYLFTQEVYLSVAEAGAALVLFLISRIIERRRQIELKKYIEDVAYETEEAKNSTVMNFPLPMVTYMLDSGRVVWGLPVCFTRSASVRASS